MNAMQEAIAARVRQNGSWREAAKALGVDHAYLWKLAKGDKDNPPDELLAKLGLRRAVTIEYLPVKRA